MNATEEYLDKLLRGVTGEAESEPEEGPEALDIYEEQPEEYETEEPVTEVEPVVEAEPIADMETVVDGTPIVDNEQAIDEMLFADYEPFSDTELTDDADSLLSDLPQLDVPDDGIQEEETRINDSSVSFIEPVAAEDSYAETIVDTDETIQPDYLSAESDGDENDEQTFLADIDVKDELIQQTDYDVNDEAVQLLDDDVSDELLMVGESVPDETPESDNGILDEISQTDSEAYGEAVQADYESFDEIQLPDADIFEENVQSGDELYEEVPQADNEAFEEPGQPENEMYNDTASGNDSSDFEDEDIASLLKDIENMGKDEAASEQAGAGASDMELEDLLSDSDDSDMSEIGELLSKDENNIPVYDSVGDAPDFTSGMLSDDEIFDGIEDIIESENKDKKKKKNKKEKKEKGFFSKLMDALLASDDDDELKQSNKFEESAVELAIEGAEENDAILAELEAAGTGKKKEKKKKGKKSDIANAVDEDGIPKPDPKAEKKAAKEKKKAEKKRLRAERKAAEDALPKIKLSKKKVIPICVLCFSLGVVITLCAFLMPTAMDKQKAREQYDRQNYEETYSLLKGHSLNDKEQLMYDRTVTLLQEERKLDSFNNYMSLDMKPEALNALVQGIKKYYELTDRASELEVTSELDGIYNQIASELQNTFAVSVDKALEWLSIDDVEEYSYIINSYANGNQNSIIEGMESENGSDVNVWDNSVISAEEAEIQ